jgi:diacylglycerol kinase family enzyme
MPALIQVLADRGVEAEAIETTGPGTAGALAAIAAAAGGDIVFAFGGDGTVHEVLQGLVGAETALGIIPIGTANALARNLKISGDPVRAAAQQASAEAGRIAVGQVSYTNSRGTARGDPCRRFFTVMAGAGPDGALVYSMLSGEKSAMGRTAYYAHAAQLFLTKSFPPFQVTYRLQGSQTWNEERAVSVMASRIPDLGGIFSRLTPGSSLHAETLRLFLIRPPAPVSLPSWFVFGQLGIHGANPWLTTLDVEEFRCEPPHQATPTHAQADGEWIGTLPVSVSLVPSALSLLIPIPDLSKLRASR